MLFQEPWINELGKMNHEYLLVYFMCNTLYCRSVLHAILLVTKCYSRSMLLKILGFRISKSNWAWKVGSKSLHGWKWSPNYDNCRRRNQELGWHERPMVTPRPAPPPAPRPAPPLAAIITSQGVSAPCHPEHSILWILFQESSPLSSAWTPHREGMVKDQHGDWTGSLSKYLVDVILLCWN